MKIKLDYQVDSQKLIDIIQPIDSQLVYSGINHVETRHEKGTYRWFYYEDLIKNPIKTLTGIGWRLGNYLIKINIHDHKRLIITKINNEWNAYMIRAETGAVDFIRYANYTFNKQNPIIVFQAANGYKVNLQFPLSCAACPSYNDMLVTGACACHDAIKIQIL